MSEYLKYKNKYLELKNTLDKQTDFYLYTAGSERQLSNQNFMDKNL